MIHIERQYVCQLFNRNECLCSLLQSVNPYIVKLSIVDDEPTLDVSVLSLPASSLLLNIKQPAWCTVGAHCQRSDLNHWGFSLPGNGDGCPPSTDGVQQVRSKTVRVSKKGVYNDPLHGALRPLASAVLFDVSHKCSISILLEKKDRPLYSFSYLYLTVFFGSC